MPTSDPQLTRSERVTLALSMDRVIPPVEGLPGAGGMGLAEHVEMLSQRAPRLRAALISVLDGLSLDDSARVEGGFAALDGERQDDALRVLETGIPEQFAGFLELIYSAYYTDSRVHERVGWVGRPPQPAGFELDPWDDSVLENIRSREPFWRKVG